MEAPSRNGNGWVRNVVWGVVLAVALLAFVGGKYYVQSVSDAFASLQLDVREIRNEARNGSLLISGALAEHKSMVEGLARVERKLDTFMSQAREDRARSR